MKALTVALSAMWLAGSAMAEVGPDDLYIKKVKARGSGCPEGSVDIDISPDKQVFTALFDSFLASIDPTDDDIKHSDRKKRCSLKLKVHVPNGWQFAVFQADYIGWYDLDPGMKLVQTSSYRFQGNKRHKTRSVIKSRGENISGDFNFTDKMGVMSYEWSACGAPRNLFITADLRLSSNNPDSVGSAGIDEIEGQFKMKSQFQIMWRECEMPDDDDDDDDDDF